jgi:SagB-type dehydrogenase family enzyme
MGAVAIRRRTFLAAGSIALLGACADDVGPAGRSAAASALSSPVRARGPRLETVLAARRSIREFSERSVDAGAVSQLLWAAQGVTAAWGGRTAPSAGGLYPIEVYAATADALVRYVTADHATVEVAPEDRRLRIALATGQEAPAGAPVLIVITGVISRTAAKYGDRAERYVHLEAGHVCQNVLLEATALGLAAVPIGAFSDDDLRAALGVEEGELPLYVVPIGHPAEGA